MWRVVLYGRESGIEYRYEVDAPKTSLTIDVVDAAYRQHGRLKAAGLATEFASMEYEVEWVK